MKKTWMNEWIESNMNELNKHEWNTKWKKLTWMNEWKQNKTKWNKPNEWNKTNNHKWKNKQTQASSAAGLTATVVRDQDTGEFSIEAGALMLVNKMKNKQTWIKTLKEWMNEWITKISKHEWIIYSLLLLLHFLFLISCFSLSLFWKKGW